MFLTERYIDQVNLWPKSGRHILAQYDADTIIVYQAYRPEIGQYAVEHGVFGGEFSYNRMSWIKPNFLWMMYRSGWGTKPGQEVTLAIRISRNFFDKILALAVESSYSENQFSNPDDWHHSIRTSRVRFQWDPDHSPGGASLDRRALQLGLRGKVLREFGKKEILEITDISNFVNEQRQNNTLKSYNRLLTPIERVFAAEDPEIRIRLGLE